MDGDTGPPMSVDWTHDDDDDMNFYKFSINFHQLTPEVSYGYHHQDYSLCTGK
jgi:hypothetical protein